MQADLLELFGKTTADLSDKDAKVLEDQWADELENMDTFVLSNGSFVRMPATRVGHFFDEECYVFMCTQVDDLRAVPLLTFFVQWRQLAEEASGEDDEEEMECVAYFWQGRKAKNLGWLTFTFRYLLPS